MTIRIKDFDSLDWTCITIITTLLSLYIGISIWESKTCLEYGPHYTVWTTQFYDGHTPTLVPITVQDCLKRKP